MEGKGVENGYEPHGQSCIKCNNPIGVIHAPGEAISQNQLFGNRPLFVLVFGPILSSGRLPEVFFQGIQVSVRMFLRYWNWQFDKKCLLISHTIQGFRLAPWLSACPKQFWLLFQAFLRWPARSSLFCGQCPKSSKPWDWQRRGRNQLSGSRILPAQVLFVSDLK